MPWFKVDDGWWSHPKTLQLSDAAQALWLRAGSWSMGHLTDGAVPKAALSLLQARKRAADELVASGMWDEDGSGYRFHDWDEYQPSREAVLADRAAGSARQAVARNPDLRASVRVRDGDKCRYCGTNVAWNDRRGGHGGTYDHVVPNGGSTAGNLVVCCRACNSQKGRRTPEEAGMVLIPESKSDLGSPSSPSRPDPSPKSSSTKKTVTASRGARLDPAWLPPSDEVARAKNSYAAHVDLKAEHDVFVDYWVAQAGVKGVKADWLATWRNWMRRKEADSRGRTGGRVTPEERARQTLLLAGDVKELE